VKIRGIPSIAKIRRPVLSGIVLRERLFRLLDDGDGKSVILVSGPAGSGKTTLAASYLDSRKIPCLWYQMDEGDTDLSTFFYYLGLAAKGAAPGRRKPLPLLTPEYALGIFAFTRRYFENLFSRLKPPFALVLDNYQDVPESSGLHEVIAHGLDTIPAGISVILLSRREPPSQFARLRADNRVKVVEWDELRLTLSESGEIAGKGGKSGLAEQNIEDLHARTEGWVAGIVLMREAAKVRGVGGCSAEGSTPKEIFDYFANEVFKKSDAEVQTFLIKTAFLPDCTASLAEKLTGVGRAGAILSSLYRNHFFTGRHSGPEPSYQYHPLFREFLLSMATELLTAADLLDIRRTAAALLEESGKPEDAFVLLRSAADGKGMAGLVLDQAQPLVEQGRSATLREWIESLPPEIRRNTPWVMYWLGVCKLLEDPVAAMACFEKAFESFDTEADSDADPAGLMLSWCGIVEGTFFAWSTFAHLDRWIAELEALRVKFPLYPSPSVEIRVVTGMFTALSMRQPSHPHMPLWEDRLMASMLSCGDIDMLLIMAQRLVLYYTLTGNTAKANLLLRHLQGMPRGAFISPLDFITLKAMEAYYLSSGGFSEDCHNAVAAGLLAADESGVHLLDFTLLSIGAYSSLATGNLAAARQNLRDMSERLIRGRVGDISHYHYLLSWEAMLREDLAQAREHGIVFMEAIAQFGASLFAGLNHIAFALVLTVCGDHAGAELHLESARLTGEKAGSALIAYKYHIAKAYLSFERGLEQEGLEQLAEALYLGRVKQIYSSDWWLPRVMSRLCVTALEEGLEATYVQELIRRHGLIPDVPSLHIEHWPRPLKIYTLGRFEIERDGEPLLFSGKVQKKPIELLKALIAFGEGGAAEEHLSDALWPDAQGDAAHNGFKVTLSRLRRLLGHEGAVRLQEGIASLDLSCCWVDTWAFERMSREAGAVFSISVQAGERNTERMRKGDEALRVAGKALALYKGHFLRQDEKLPWAVSFRERLRDRLLSLITGAGAYLERTGRWIEATRYYQRALEIDDLAEALYQRLIVCHGNLGEKAEALKVYTRCRSVLSAVLSVEPSPQTEALKEEALKRS